jgi:hypothetical protein
MPWFAHIQGGVCFSCHGNGWILGKGSPPRRATTEPGRRWRRDGARIIQA